MYLDLTPLLRVGPLRRRLPKLMAAVNEPAADAMESLVSRRSEAFPERGRLADVRTATRVVRRHAPKLAPVVARMLGRFVRALKETPREERFRFASRHVDPDGAVPTAKDESIAESRPVEKVISEAAEGDAVVISDDDARFAAVKSSLNEAFDGAFETEDDATEYVDHNGTIVETEYSFRPPLAKDWWVTAYYHVVDSELYRTEDEVAEPTDGTPVDC